MSARFRRWASLHLPWKPCNAARLCPNKPILCPMGK